MLVDPVLPEWARRRRVKVKAATVSPPVDPRPVLAGAVYAVGESVTLSFDRAVDITQGESGVFTVVDAADAGRTFGGNGMTLVGTAAVRVDLYEMGGAQGDDVRLNAGSNNGIAAVDGGLTWDGVSGLVLPFGQAERRAA